MIKIIGVGKIKEKAMKTLVDEYIKRVSAYTKVEVIEVRDESASDKNSEAENRIVMEREGERALKHVKERDYMVLLDLHGESVSSERWAEKMSAIVTYHSSDITFVIGGSLGVSNALIQRSDYRWKLSELTLTHQFVRLFVLEQIYRAYKINNNETYHK